VNPKLQRGELVGAAPDGLVERAKALAFEPRGQPLVDAPRDAEPLVDKARVELHESRARADFLPGVFGVKDAADADNLQRAARQPAERGDQTRRALAQRRAAQSALAAGVDGLRVSAEPRARGRRVGRDDARDPRAARRFNYQLKLARFNVRSDLDEQRDAASAFSLRQLAVAALERAEQRAEQVRALQLAQTRRVGRADVDGHVVGVRPDRLEAGEVVGGRLFDGHGAALADVDAEHAVGSRVCEPAREGSGAFVVEPLPVDERAVERQAEESGARVAGLRQIRHRAHLDEAEAERGKLRRHAPVLIEARRDADRVGKTQAEAAQLSKARAFGRPPRDATQRRRAEAERERVKCELVCRLRRQLEEQGTQQRAIEHHGDAEQGSAQKSESSVTEPRKDCQKLPTLTEASNAAQIAITIQGVGDMICRLVDKQAHEMLQGEEVIE
jgi:hypothetical protein